MQKIFIKAQHLKSFIRKNRLHLPHTPTTISAQREVSTEELIRSGKTECEFSNEAWCVGDTILELTVSTSKSFRFLRVLKDKVVVESINDAKQKFIEKNEFKKNKEAMKLKIGITDLEYDVIDRNLAMA